MLRFYDDIPPDRLAPAMAMTEAAAFEEPAGPTVGQAVEGAGVAAAMASRSLSSTFSSSSSSSAADARNARAKEKADGARRSADRATRAADRAAGNATECPEPARAAESAAARAREAANEASLACAKICDPDTRKKERKQAEEELDRACANADTHRDAALRAQKEGAIGSAKAAERRARDSADKAADYEEEILDLAEKYPEVKKLSDLADEVETNKLVAQDAADKAGREVDRAIHAGSIEEAEVAADEAKALAQHGKAEEDNAYRKSKEARALARRAEKSREERIPSEPIPSEEERDPRDLLREKEHEEEIERRRQMLHEGDANEGLIHQRATGTAFHSPVELVESKNSLLCCGAGAAADSDSEFSDSSTRLGDRDLAGSVQGPLGVTYPILEDGFEETFGRKSRPWCWCCGCGCFHCCGEC